MYKGSLKNFFLAKTSHRIPKILTLGVASCALVAMVNIDASASAFGGRDQNVVRTDVVLTLASESSSSQFSGLVKRWVTVTSVLPTTTTSTTSVVTGSAGGDGASAGGDSTSGAGGGASGGGSGGTGGGSSVTTTTTTTPPTTTTTTPAPPSSSTGGPITAGASRSDCLTSDSGVAGSLSTLEPEIANFQAVTGSTVTCLGAYGSDETWSDWTDPWFTGGPGAGYTAWIAADPQVRQMVLGISLIPASLSDPSDPLGWEQSCAAGNFNAYASELGTNLVAAGMQNSVIRLGWEMNGSWEGDFIGTTTQEQSLWATCFDNEVTALRSVSGEHFLIDWNPNSCTAAVPYANYYPGNAYVDIMGLDIYDQSCMTPNTAVSFSQLASVPSGLNAFEAFATAQGKPMSFPEWGLTSSSSGDDPAYINGIGSAVNNGNFAFQQYFDVVDGDTMLLGTGTPLSNAAFQQQFGNS